MEKYTYMPELKTFSPAWNKKKYEKNLKGYTNEFMHNIFRLIMRPNNQSRQHWFDESFAWLDDALTVKLDIKKRPFGWLFSYISDSSTSPKLDFGSNTEYLHRKVTRESQYYGPVENSDIAYIKSKIKELYEAIDETKLYKLEEAFKLFLDWFNSIDNLKNKITPQY